MQRGVAILEITGLGPALVTIDTIEKAAPVEILQYELNDFYGVCVRVAGLAADLEAALQAAQAQIHHMGGSCVSTILYAPAAESAEADADRSFVLAFPLASTHAGIYLGNGNVGVIVWGTPDKLILTCLPASLR